MSEFTSLKRELLEIDLTNANKTIEATHTNWALNAERPKRYFLNLHKIHAKNKAITKLVNGQGQTLTNHADILEEDKSEEELEELDQLGLSRYLSQYRDRPRQAKVTVLARQTKKALNALNAQEQTGSWQNFTPHSGRL